MGAMVPVKLGVDGRENTMVVPFFNSMNLRNDVVGNRFPSALCRALKPLVGQA